MHAAPQSMWPHTAPSTPQPTASITDASEYWVARSSRAMTAERVVRSHLSNTHPPSRGAMRPRFAKKSGLLKIRGRRESRVPDAPAAAHVV
jgi:hypothetical protein